MNLLSATFVHGRDTPFLEDGEGTWTTSRLLALAREVASAVPSSSGGTVGVRARSASFIAASLLGIWSIRRQALLLDPDLQDEPEGLPAGGGFPVVAPEREPKARPSDLVVREGRGKPLDPVLPEDGDRLVAFLTSGSTGAPKIVAKRGYQFARQFEVELGCLGLDGPITVLSLVPAFHILGFVYGIYDAAASGGRSIFSVGTTPQEWVNRLRSVEPDLVVAVPSLYRVLNQIADRPLPSAVYLSSGSPLPAEVGEVFEARNGQPIVQVYGSTETGGVAHRTGEGAWRPLPGLLWSTDPEQRLCVSSPWQDRPGEGFETGDRAEAHEDGFRLLGRIDSVVKVGGKRFALDEIVQAALRMPEVGEAAATTYLRYGEPALALFVAPRSGAPLAPHHVREFLARSLAPYKLPRTLRVLDALPRRGIGKTDQEALRRMAES